MPSPGVKINANTGCYKCLDIGFLEWTRGCNDDQIWSIREWKKKLTRQRVALEAFDDKGERRQVTPKDADARPKRGACRLFSDRNGVCRKGKFGQIIETRCSALID